MNTKKTIKERIEELEKRVATLEISLRSAVPTTSKPKKLSAKEFLMTKVLKTEIQKTLALAYYLERMESMKRFNVADLEIAFRSAKEKKPKNINDAVNKNIAHGLLMEAAEKKETKKAWELTSTGEKYVEEEL